MIKLFDICQEIYFRLCIFLLFFWRQDSYLFLCFPFWCPYILYRPIGHVSQRTIYPNIVLMPMMIDFAPASLVQKWNIHKLYSCKFCRKLKDSYLLFLTFYISACGGQEMLSSSCKKSWWDFQRNVEMKRRRYCFDLSPKSLDQQSLVSFFLKKELLWILFSKVKSFFFVYLSLYKEDSALWQHVLLENQRWMRNCLDWRRKKGFKIFTPAIPLKR